LEVAEFGPHFFMDQVDGRLERVLKLNWRIASHCCRKDRERPRFHPQAEFSCMNLADTIVFAELKGVLNKRLNRCEH
jgi:hypothetical protein